jgi:tRNA modification GTPase
MAPTDPTSPTTRADTIYALSSAPGRAGVAVIRVSGPAAANVLSRLAGIIPRHREARPRTLRHPTSGIALDRALVLYFKGPASETGEDIAELQVHGSRAVIAAVLAALAIVPGCRLAAPGEFAMRAFHNGKIDLTAAEGPGPRASWRRARSAVRRLAVVDDRGTSAGRSGDRLRR